MEFLCLDFINSRPDNEDDADDAWLHELCHKWELPEPEKDIRDDLPRLHTALSLAAWEYGTDGTLSPASLYALNAQLKPVSLHNLLEPSYSGFRVRGIAQQGESRLLPYRIVMSFAYLISNHEAGRLKVCENPDCGWVFYDESKSRTRRWCDNTCASLIKVRRFRKKHIGA